MTSYYLDVLKRKFGAERRQPFHSVQVLILIKLITLYGAKNDGLRPDLKVGRYNERTTTVQQRTYNDPYKDRVQ
jgi:hypothetical protein